MDNNENFRAHFIAKIAFKEDHGMMIIAVYYNLIHLFHELGRSITANKYCKELDGIHHTIQLQCAERPDFFRVSMLEITF